MIILNVIGCVVLGTTLNFTNPVLPVETSVLNETSWELVEQDEKITIYERWVSLPGGRQTRERKGVFTVDIEASKVLPYVSSAEGIKNWMNGVEESNELGSDNSGSKYVYLFFDAPWPFQNRDMVTSITTVSSCEFPCFDVYFSATNGYFPEKEDVIRLKSYEAHWKIEETGFGKTQISFSAMSDTPPVAPRWVQDPITAGMFKDNLLGLMELLTLND